MAMRPHPRRAGVDPDNLRDATWSTDDRSGFILNHRDMRWQYAWAGPQLINLQLLVAPDMYDIPQEQLRTIVIPPDPAPIFNLRPEPYTIDETDWRSTNDGDIRETQDDELRVTMPSQYEATDESTG